MAIAAVPGFLGRDFSQASPGLRFGMYLPFWGVDGQTGLPTWTTHDLNQRGAGPRQEPQCKDDKSAALKQTVKLFANDLALMRALAARQAAAANAIASVGSLLELSAVAIAPFTTGLGNEHPLENGFAFLNPYGLPYLPGSGVKGVLRQAAGELESGDWGDRQGWTKDAITHLFGLEAEPGGENHQRGALSFWDVLPQVPDEGLQVEVMTPHQSHYYQQRVDAKSGGSSSPHDSGQPIPINFLTVPPGARFVFHVQCDQPFLARLDPAWAADRHWQTLLLSAFNHAFQWLGFGAKTAVGYGAMSEDPAAAKRREAIAEASRLQREEAARQAALAAMSPEDAAWAEAQPVLEQFRVEFEKARAAGAYNPGGPFNVSRQAFMKRALAWTEARSRVAAGQALADSATKAWGRPSNKDRWAELQAAINVLQSSA
jgi:CRISPR-associated protein Cmr6